MTQTQNISRIVYVTYRGTLEDRQGDLITHFEEVPGLFHGITGEQMVRGRFFDGTPILCRASSLHALAEVPVTDLGLTTYNG